MPTTDASSDEVGGASSVGPEHVAHYIFGEDTAPYIRGYTMFSQHTPRFHHSHLVE